MDPNDKFDAADDDTGDEIGSSSSSGPLGQLVEHEPENSEPQNPRTTASVERSRGPAEYASGTAEHDDDREA